MQFLLFKEEKFYALCTLKDKNFAPKQNGRDCPMTPCITGHTPLSCKRQLTDLELIWISRSGMKCLTIFMRLACERRRASEIGIADSCNDLGAMAWAIAPELV